MTRPPVPKPTPREKPPKLPGSTLRQSGKGLQRGGRLPVKNAQRQSRRDELGIVYGPHYAWVRDGCACLLASAPGHSCSGRIDAHHVDTIGHGGIDAANCVRLCRGAHRMDSTSVHRMGRPAFEAYWRVDLRYEAVILWHNSPHRAVGVMVGFFVVMPEPPDYEAFYLILKRAVALRYLGVGLAPSEGRR